MNFTNKHSLKFIFLFFFSMFYSQIYKNDSLRGNFTYLLKSKSNTLQPNYIHEELFSLQISDDRSFFISEKALQFDSIFLGELKFVDNGSKNVVDFRGKSFPKSTSNFMIIQTNDYIQYYRSLGMSLLSYKSPIITKWKLVNETKTINSLICKKAELSFKGRDWIAWYSSEIQFPYGPYKFSGLPGLIVKITDKKGDYDFELVKSLPTSSMRRKIITIDKSRYENSTLVTKNELDKAKENFNNNLSSSLENMGVKFTPEQKENLRLRQKNNELEKKGYNPIELEN
ncbi:GLPGLI family protein [Chryseobacterium aquaticum]|uniref:GLPGLI family protein n=1 Tax=Chryseobacterium aquaticum TaxID=452084 RepID=UPI003F72A2E6